jgi:hypothetical protein
MIAYDRGNRTGCENAEGAAVSDRRRSNTITQFASEFTVQRGQGGFTGLWMHKSSPVRYWRVRHIGLFGRRCSILRVFHADGGHFAGA